jgi:hypothetical protein
MGIFEKLKNNFSHGGVSLLLVTSAKVDANDPTLPECVETPEQLGAFLKALS